MMNQGHKIGIVVTGLAASLVLLTATLQIGGGQIRTASSLYEHRAGKLLLGGGVLQRGVPVTIGYDRGDVLPSGQAAFLQVKSERETFTVSGIDPAKLNSIDSEFSVVIPCSKGQLDREEKVRLILTDKKRGLLAVSDEVRIEEPGQECFYSQ